MDTITLAVIDETLAAIAKTATLAAVETLGATLKTEATVRERRTIADTITEARTLTAILDRAFILAGGKHGTTADPTTFGAVCKALKIDDGATWSGWSRSALRDAWKLRGVNVHEAWSLWLDLVDAFEPAAKTTAKVAGKINGATIHPDDARLFKLHASAFIDWSDRYTRGIAASDGTFAHDAKTRKARNERARSLATAVTTAANVVTAVSEGSAILIVPGVSAAMLSAFTRDDAVKLRDALIALLASDHAFPDAPAVPAPAAPVVTGADETEAPAKVKRTRKAPAKV